MPVADLVIHLEDNEEHLSEVFTKTGHSRLCRFSDEELAARLPLNLAHPRKSQDFLRSADGVTGIIARLADFVPPGVPFHELWPTVDFTLYHPGPPDSDLRDALGIRPEEKIVCYTGNSHFANRAEVQSLYEGVLQINRRGTPCRLVRTGADDEGFAARFAADELARHVLPLGHVERARLPALLRLADVLVQPGEVDEFNRYRLPSKLPEFLASGRPVLMPDTNVGLRVRSGEEALILANSSPEEIADQCQKVFSDPALAQRLSEGAAVFARRNFDQTANSKALDNFYRDVCLLWHRSA